MSILTFLILALAGQAAGQTMHGGLIRGDLIDATGAGLPAGKVRVLQPGSNTVLTRARADGNGIFQSGTLVPGTYLVVAWATGFRSHRIADVLIQNGEVTDLGKIQLDISSCDDPSVNCDTFGITPSDFALARGFLELKIGQQNRSPDLRLIRNARGVYLEGINGSTLSQPNMYPLDCRAMGRGESQVQIDGLGPGDYICVQMPKGRVSHLFLKDDVEADSDTVSLWQVTRKRRIR